MLENLLCLVSNSVKFVGKVGELRCRILLHNSSILNGRLASLLFEVQDDGIDYVFQPFN